MCSSTSSMVSTSKVRSSNGRSVATPTIAIQYTSAQQPVVLRGVGDETYTYVAMPMTL